MGRKISVSNPNKYYSEKLVIDQVGTKSQAKLKHYADHEIYKYSISAYLFYNFEEDQLKSDELKALRKRYEVKHKQKGGGKNHYRETGGWIHLLGVRTERDLEYKIEMVERINFLVNESTIKLTDLAKDYNVNYQVLYKILRNKKYNKMSKDKLKDLWQSIEREYGSRL